MAKKILLIDDDKLNITLTQTRLESKGYEVAAAYNGEEGLLAVEEFLPDLIILDVEMPVMNGYTFLNTLKKKEKEYSSIPVLVLTAHDEMQPIFQLKGVRGYLIKPINFDLLFEKISEQLS
jgi:CheY-like chemotaxis protein